MADPAGAASASAAANDDDVDDLYADLDDQVTAALAAAGESGGSNAKDSDADANEAVDLGDGLAGYSSSSSSSEDESEDDLHIVLNEDGCAPPPPSAGRCDGESEERELRASLLKGLSGSDGGPRKVCFANLWGIATY
jgi:pre-mRNA 3'-end-processing factor FIP1